MTGSAFVLFGAGGHARAIVELLAAGGHRLAAYVDPRAADWLGELRRLDDDAAASPEMGRAAIGLGGIRPDALERRLGLLDALCARGFEAPALRHADATVSGGAHCATGTVVLARAVLQPNARVERGAIVNTGAIVEHDAAIGAGAHVAPGAIVLGGARIGRAAMIGAGAVVLPGAAVADGATVPAVTRWPQ